MMIFRKLEETLQRFGVDVLSAEGRGTLLEVFSRRGEINNGQKLAFIADRDWWVCAAIPEKFVSPALIFTDGYSIENDVYRDGNLFGYMTLAERTRFSQEVDQVINCYALGLSRILNGRSGRISWHPNEVLDDAGRRAGFMQLEGGEVYPDQLRIQVAANFEKLLRGKTLMGVLMRQLSYAGRAARHNAQSLMEVVSNNRGPLLNRLFSEAEQIFAQ